MPTCAPTITNDGWVGRQLRIDVHRNGPRQHVIREHTATHVVDVIGVAVVGGVDRHNRLQCWWLAGGHLERGEPAPRIAHHPHRTGTPRLLGKPGDYLDGICLLLGEVLIEQEAFGVARTTDIKAHGCVPVARKPRVAAFVCDGSDVILAVRDRLENCWNRMLRRVGRKPNSCRQTSAIFEWNPYVVYPSNFCG